VVHEEFGIVEGLMTTVHATTGIFANLLIAACSFLFLWSIRFFICSQVASLTSNSFLPSNTEDCRWPFYEGLARGKRGKPKYNSKFNWCCEGKRWMDANFKFTISV